jgi:hypothetical protein
VCRPHSSGTYHGTMAESCVDGDESSGSKKKCGGFLDLPRDYQVLRVSAQRKTLPSAKADRNRTISGNADVLPLRGYNGSSPGSRSPHGDFWNVTKTLGHKVDVPTEIRTEHLRL